MGMTQTQDTLERIKEVDMQSYTILKEYHTLAFSGKLTQLPYLKDVDTDNPDVLNVIQNIKQIIASQ